MRMIDISAKEVTEREAIVNGVIFIKPQVIRMVRQKKMPKGDVLEAAKIAGILAAKKTPGIIPLCHPISIESIKIDFSLRQRKIEIRSIVKGNAKTGVEMEALTAVAAAALTIYDMCKAFDKEMVISDIRLIRKTGGKSGTYVRN